MCLQPTLTYFQRSFIHYLAQMIHILEKCGTSADPSLEQHLHTRLTDNMLTMSQQFSTAASFSLRATCWLRGVELVSFQQLPLTRQSLLRELQQSLNYIEKIRAEDFGDWESKTVHLTIGQNDTQLSGRDLVEIYAIPNFFFHMSMGYAILRQQGFDLGKGDFDGLHIYAPGFSFCS